MSQSRPVHSDAAFCMTISCLLQNRDEQHQDDDQHENRRQLLVIVRFPGYLPKTLPRLIQSRLMPIYMPIYVVQKLYMAVKFVANLDAKLPLPVNGLSQTI